ncbi:MAG: shikimate dehydrogenase [Candidatus Marinarcus sp.]|uniref:shikimate dehydrogenase n=1 Tax=Candidatus Marinarcus sp. TaxID=3100987 RepID=UPI003B007E69
MNNKQIKFAIFGDPVEHSKSPQMHNNGFKSIHLNALYEKYHLLDGKTLKTIFLKQEYKGANITVPHKEEAFKQADEVIGLAKKIGAVNTYVKKNNKILAYNTDAPGFLKAIESFGEINSVLILGAGGTAKALAVALMEQHKEVTVLNRSENRLDFFRQLGCKTYSWDNFELKSYDLVVNSTSAGLKDSSYPVDKVLLKEIFQHAKYAFDCIYGKTTPFQALAKESHLKLKDGEDMLLYQGVLAFEYFTDTICNDQTIEAMRKGLKANQ